MRTHDGNILDPFFQDEEALRRHKRLEKRATKHSKYNRATEATAAAVLMTGALTLAFSTMMLSAFLVAAVFGGLAFYSLREFVVLGRFDPHAPGPNALTWNKRSVYYDELDSISSRLRRLGWEERQEFRPLWEQALTIARHGEELGKHPTFGKTLADIDEVLEEAQVNQARLTRATRQEKLEAAAAQIEASPEVELARFRTRHLRGLEEHRP